jgi:outer membrane protein assembly factor BamB
MGAAGVCMVTHNGDSGINSLRWCISYANTNGGADTIQFGITDARIDLLTALPPLTDPAGVTIDGSGRKIVISGHFLSPSDGIRIQSANNTIKDISIIRFRSDAGAPFGASGIRITGIASTDNQIIGCRIGTDYLDKTGYDNANGVIIENQAARNIITSETGAKSVISGNYHAAAGHGIYINGAKNTTIVKSIIGAKSDGISLLENYGSGIYIEGDGSDDTVIGGDTGVSMGNLISGNNGYGIFISDGDNTKIYGNYIGVDNSGNTILANKKDGVRIINSAKSTLVGNHNNGFRNVLSGNGGSGVHVEGAASTVNIILNNYIGVGADGATPAGNKNAGVYLKSVPYTYVGVDHLDNGSGNIIANSSTYGVILNGADAQNNLIQYNKIGVDKNGNAAGNTAGGILIIGSASNNRIGAKDHNLDGANDIAHNKRNGIEARDSGSVRNKFFKNSFYQNQGLAVDLNNDGVTPNSSTPPGPNDYTDFPVITQITSAGGNCYNISGTKAPNTYAHIYYASKPSAAAQPDPSGNGEGYEYHGMSSSAVAAATFTYSGICFSECMAISTLGHDTNGNTSEFGPWYDLCIAPVISDVQFTPDTVIANGMQKTRVTATVTYANGMSYISAVTVNLTDAGGPVALPLYDDGAHADGAAGDGVYGSDRFSVPESVAAGDKNIPVTASDLLGKSGSAAGTLTVQTIALPQPCGEDWPMFSCNTANSGQSAQTFKWPLTLKWSKTTDFSSNIYTSPAIFETHIYVGENSGRAYAVNKADGSLAWQYDTGGDSFRDNAPAVWNNSVFFAAESGKMYSLNRLSGTLNWIFDTGGRIRGSSPVIANDTLYFGSETGTFYALNPSTKAVKWSYSPGFGSTYSFGDSPAAVVNGVVYATSNNCTVYALDAFTGELYWSRELTTATCQIAGSGVTVSGDYVCTSTWDDDRAYCLNKYTGAIVWSAYNPNAFVDSNGALYNGMYILGTGDGTLAAYDIQTGALRWQTSLDNSLAFSSPVVFNDYVYVTDGAWSVNRGVLYALDPNDNGREVWRYDAGANIVSSPAVSGNLLVFGTSNDASSALLAFEPGTSYKCPGWTVTTSAADGDGSLYDCVMAANESAGTQTISFSISNAVIKPVNPIPFEDYGGPVIIDASGRNIIVDGSDCALCSGFEIAADNSSLKGLAVVQYRRDGRHAIDIQADGVTIDSCRVGTNFIDSTAIGNSSGIYVAGANNKIINSVIAGNSKTGVTIDGTDTTGTLVQNNKIGVKSTGMAALKNGTGGILITGGAHANTIGGSASASQGNIISGNTPGYAVRITGPGADNNAVQGNIIGLGLIGSPALPNNGGVQIFSGARGTVVGGTQDYGNVISGNYGTAVNLSTAPDTVIRGNIIGLSRDGLQTRSNTEYGIAIYEGYNAVVGGAATERNIISANEKSGIYAISTSGMSIRNNLIGVKQDMTPAGNLQTGITFTATVTATTIGGAAGDANVIANNGGAGVEVTGSPAGLTIRANSIYENGGKGIVTGHDYSLSIDTVIKNGSAYDATGASTCGACTVEIFQADDTGAGVSADPAGSGEGYDLLATVTTDAAGAWSATGLTPSANANYISATITDSGGNTTEFAANKKLPRTECPGFVVSSNADAGYATLRQCMAEANADNAPSDITFHTSMSGKTITLASGLPTLTDNATTIRNTSGGQVTVSGGGNPWYCFSILSSNNEIRGLTIVKCGDMTAGHGIGISGSTATNNLIAGNYIGTNSSGAAGLGNRTGILITSSAYANTIGGTTAADRNVVSGNTVGVNLHTTTSNNMVIGNYIGTNPLGTGKVANFVGVVISSGSNLNTVGGTDSSRRNLVSGNSIGILIQGAGSDANKIYGNYIGSDKNGDKVSNLQNGTGVKIETSAKNNAVGGAFTGQPNRIVFNDSHGVLIKDSGTTGNTVSRNVTFDNAGKGIALESGGNASRAAPSIVTITALGAGAYDISGTTAPACAGCTVELFRVDDTASSVGQDATLAGEAYAFVATATTTAAGAWSFTNLTITGGRYVTATVTDTNGNTSEFALNKRLNASPVISSLTSSSVDVSFYEAVTLSATASDPDGDPLTYEWSGGGHSPFSATTSASTNWTAPRDAYWATLTLTVRDPYGGMDTESVPVRVGIKDISNIKVFPHTSEIKRNSSRTFEIQAHFTTGAIFDISAESAKVKNGLGTINTNGFFQAGSTTGNEEVTFTVGRFMGTISVKIIP